MTFLSSTLTPDSVNKVHDAIICLAKFSESVYIEAHRHELILSTINTSKSAHASFVLNGGRFFTRYRYSPGISRGRPATDADERPFACRIYNKALLSVFKGRISDPKEKDTAVEKCEIALEDRPDKAECRLVIRMICMHGVVKTYKLTYEPAEAMHALFDDNAVVNRWQIQSRLLREFIDYFGPKTEQLDMYKENGRVTFTSYTEKITDGKEILKQPLQTSVAIDTLEFEDFSVEERLHIAISVKDFKAIVMHADTISTSVSARYSLPSRPLQITYEGDGMLCKYTLMTIGDYRASSTTPAPALSADGRLLTRDGSRMASVPVGAHSASSMPPPQRPASHKYASESFTQRTPRPSPPPPKASLDPESLFVPQDEDAEWDDYQRVDQSEDVLGWDASGDHHGVAMHFSNDERGTNESSQNPPNDSSTMRIAPTQRLSEVRGLFD
ncbi:DNA repair protein rad9 [Xylona heveae TC161]|uniref:DNA repair protein rad9 n=1 Tax=Xylona heveae (strain CBS 132557 / TC161) TaxID=1328760 RepID=A0A165GY29_XYLHT|nr:DNA repair protein rad9 [Xylona heveae TC161]KZF22748.1 DNA repair protein rad9 [Xylona heveae TC161]